MKAAINDIIDTIHDRYATIHPTTTRAGFVVNAPAIAKTKPSGLLSLKANGFRPVTIYTTLKHSVVKVLALPSFRPVTIYTTLKRKNVVNDTAPVLDLLQFTLLSNLRDYSINFGCVLDLLQFTLLSNPFANK